MADLECAATRILPELWSTSLYEPMTETDLVFHCSDGAIQAHKVLLKTLCKTIQKCLDERPQLEEDNYLNIFVPEVTVNTVTKFLEVLYTGSSNLVGNEFLAEVRSFGREMMGFEMDSSDSFSVEKVVEVEHYRSGFFDGNEDVEDCSVAPPICVYLSDNDEDNRDQNLQIDDWYQQVQPATKKRKVGVQEIVNCPECNETFATVSKLHTHAVNVHYHEELKKRLHPFFKSNRGICTICGKPSGSLLSYLFHMGVKHKVVLDVMPKEIVPFYSLLLPESMLAEDENNEGTSHVYSLHAEYFSQITKHIKVTATMPRTLQCPECHQCFQKLEILYAHSTCYHYFDKVFDLLEPEFRIKRGRCTPCNVYFDGVSSYIHHLCFHHKLLHQFFPSQINMYFNTLQARKLPKGMLPLQNSPKRNPRSSSTVKGSIPCPECEKTFDSISALYFHAAAIHHKRKLLELYGEEYKQTKGICSVCSSKLNSKQYYYIHMGSRHKVINQIMPPEILEKYNDLIKTPM